MRVLSTPVYPSLLGVVVFVVGGSGGIGADIVRAFSQQGSKVAFLGRNAQSADMLCNELAGNQQFPLS